MGQYYNISAINSQRNTEAVDNDEMSAVCDIVSINDKIINSVVIKNTTVIVPSDRVISSVELKKPTTSN